MLVIYPDMDMVQREDMLKNMCVTKEQRTYLRSLKASEVDVERGRYTVDAIELDNMQAELDNIKKEYKAKLDNMETRMKERLELIKTQKKSVPGILYGIADHANKRMLFYDKHGELIDSRDLLEHEKQGRLFIEQPNDALKDLPFETANVIKDITNSQAPAAGAPAGEWQQGDEVKDSEKPFDEMKEHNEEAWSLMSDDDLIVKYGTTNIADIRTLVYNKASGKWEQGAKKVRKGKTQTPDALNTTVEETPEEKAIREKVLKENANKNRTKKK